MRTTDAQPMWHHRFVSLVASASIIGVVSCAPSEPLPGEAQMIAEEAITVVREIRSLVFTLNDELGISATADLVTIPSGYAVADRAGFVLLLDNDLSLKARFGGVGAGPTELSSPQDLEARGSSVAVYDSGNNRIAIIDGAGELLDNFPAGTNPAGNFAWLPDNSIIVRRAGGYSGLAFFHPPARGNFGLEMPTPSADANPEDVVVDLSSGHITAGPTGQVHYYDTNLNLLYTYGVDGTLQSTLRLPDGVREQVAVDRREAEQAFRGVVGMSYVMNLTTWGEHPVIVAPGLPGVEALALVVEPERKVATPIVPGPGLGGARIPTPGALALKGNTLTIASSSGLYQYEVRYPEHLQPN